MEEKTKLEELKKAYSDISEEEMDMRNRINALRRDLTQLCKRRVRAYNAWQAESKRLVG
jgi:FtsZ-binding cell division protein ZapB